MYVDFLEQLIGEEYVNIIYDFGAELSERRKHKFFKWTVSEKYLTSKI